MTFDNWSIKHLIDHEALNAWPQFVEFLGFGAHSWNHKTQILLPTEEGFARELLSHLHGATTYRPSPPRSTGPQLRVDLYPQATYDDPRHALGCSCTNCLGSVRADGVTSQRS